MAEPFDELGMRIRIDGQAIEHSLVDLWREVRDGNNVQDHRLTLLEAQAETCENDRARLDSVEQDVNGRNDEYEEVSIALMEHSNRLEALETRLPDYERQESEYQPDHRSEQSVRKRRRTGRRAASRTSMDSEPSTDGGQINSTLHAVLGGPWFLQSYHQVDGCEHLMLSSVGKRRRHCSSVSGGSVGDNRWKKKRTIIQGRITEERSINGGGDMSVVGDGQGDGRDMPSKVNEAPAVDGDEEEEEEEPAGLSNHDGSEASSQSSLSSSRATISSLPDPALESLINNGGRESEIQSDDSFDASEDQLRRADGLPLSDKALKRGLKKRAEQAKLPNNERTLKKDSKLVKRPLNDSDPTKPTAETREGYEWRLYEDDITSKWFETQIESAVKVKPKPFQESKALQEAKEMGTALLNEPQVPGVRRGSRRLEQKRQQSLEPDASPSASIAASEEPQPPFVCRRGG